MTDFTALGNRTFNSTIDHIFCSVTTMSSRAQFEELVSPGAKVAQVHS